MKHALQFSGGIDSVALLFLLRKHWPTLHVYWANPGAPYPQTLDYMQRVAQLVPHFHEVTGMQPESIAAYGHPVDVVPVSHTRLGHAIHGTKGTRFQSYLDCCARSWWAPLERRMQQDGITDIWRGQRDDERRKAPLHDGQDVAGIRYHFPLHDWTRHDVFTFCQEHCPEWVPDYYSQGEAVSRDCWNCTAYLDENRERIARLPDEQRALVESVLDEWRALLDSALKT